MRGFIAAAALLATMLAPNGLAPAAAGTIAVQYGGYDDGYRRGDDDYYGSDDPYDDRGGYGRDRGYRSYDRGDDDRYEDRRGGGDDYGDRRDRERHGDGRRYLDDDRGGRRGVVVKKLSRKDRICLQRHSSYDPETGTFRDGRGGRKPCRV